MALITDEMRQLIQRVRLCFAATVDPQGKPNLSPKGSIEVWDDDHLVFADIASPATVDNLKKNPSIEINVVDQVLRRGFRFKGQAELYFDGPMFDAVAEALWARVGHQYPVHGVVKIKVEKALPVLSPAYTFNPGITEANVKSDWLKHYGYREVASE